MLPLVEDFTTKPLIYLGLAAFLAGLSFKKSRPATLFLGTWLLLMLALPVVKARLVTSRYMMPLGLPLTLVLSIAVIELWRGRKWHRLISVSFASALSIWAIAFAIPFGIIDLTSPHNLPLHRTNYKEYISGYLTGDASFAATITSLKEVIPPAQHIFATWTVCDLFYFYLDQPIRCLSRATSGKELLGYLKADLAPGEAGYLLSSGYSPFFTSIPYLRARLVAEHQRPFINRPVYIWRLELDHPSARN